MAKKIAIILAGCGVYDGSEIYETTLTLLNLDKAGVSYQCFAPNVEQSHVFDHLEGDVADGQNRNVLTESARLARGEILDIKNADLAQFDGLIIPGGFGVAKNLSNFAFEDDVNKLQVNPDVEKLVQGAFAADIPLGFLCISPACIAAVALRGKGLTLTIGQDEGMAQKIEALGHKHQKASAREVVQDPRFKVISTPAYMCGQGLAEVDQGIGALVCDLLSLIDQKHAQSA